MRPIYGFSIRNDGNMSFKSPESDKLVLDRRNAFLKSLSPELDNLVTLSQVHGNTVHVVEDPKQIERGMEGDGLITMRTDVALGILTADCLPIIFFDKSGRGTGIVHAGRVGSSKNISLIALQKFISLFEINPDEITVIIGPGIGKCCYEVREDTLHPFEKEFPDIKKIATPGPGKSWKLDLVTVNEFQILRAGISPGNIVKINLCTSCRSEFYSYRRDQTDERFLSVIALKEQL